LSGGRQSQEAFFLCFRPRPRNRKFEDEDEDEDEKAERTYFERNQTVSCLFNVGAPKFLFAAAGFFRLHWREIFLGSQRDD
jgi:hypothetical protein